jgi:hypothetical protein
MPDPVGSGPEGDRIAQAVEMIRSQRECGPDEAYDLLREKAFLLWADDGIHRARVLDHIIRFDA